MSHIIQDFQKWKKINEQDDVPGREKSKGATGDKIVAIPVDKTTLKLKIVNSTRVIEGGKLTTTGFTQLLSWIKSQGDIIGYYNALNDLATNIVIYSIATDNDRKQVIIFKIYSKTQLNSTEPGKPGIPKEIQFIRQDELPAALGGSVLNVSGVAASALTKDPKSVTDTNVVTATGLKLPIKAAAVVGSTDTNLINFITGAYNKAKTKAAGAKILAKVKTEVQAGKLDKGTESFIKALNAAFDIKDAKFAEDIETDITQTLVTKLAGDLNDFNAGAFTSSVTISTGDIIVPEGGFIEGVQKNAELKKFQDLLKTKLATKLRDHSTYQAFVKVGRKGFVGNYGPTTHNLVQLLKSITKNPAFPNRDGSIIEPEFVSLIQAISESYYLGLNGAILLNESEFDFGAASSIIPGGGESSTSSVSSKGTVKAKGTVVAVVAKPKDFNVKSFQEWLVNTKKESGWGASDIDGAWGPKTSTAYTKYKDTYKPGAAKSSADTLTQQYINLGNEIKRFIETRDNFTGFTGLTNDDEQGAWSKLVFPKWKSKWKPALLEIKKKTDALPKKTEADTLAIDNLNKNYARFTTMFQGTANSKSSLFEKMFLNPGNSVISFDGNYYLKIWKASGGIVEIKIAMDF